MSAADTTTQPIASRKTARHSKRRNPASASKDNQSSPSGSLTTEEPPATILKDASELPKALNKADYKPEPDFNVHEIVPARKSSKSLSRLAEAASSNKSKILKLPLARIDDCPSPIPSNDDAMVDQTAPSTSNPPVANPNCVVFTAYGIEAHMTTASINEICYTYLRGYCCYGIRCKRIHPKEKSKYDVRAQEEHRRFTETKGKARAAIQSLVMNGVNVVGPCSRTATKRSQPPSKSDSMASSVSSISTSSTTSTPSLSTSSVTTASSQASPSNSSTISSKFYSTHTSSVASSSSKASESPSSPESSPSSVESPLDTPTLPCHKITPDTPRKKPLTDIRSSGPVKAPKFYSATINGSEFSSSQSSGLLTGKVNPSVPNPAASNSPALPRPVPSDNLSQTSHPTVPNLPASLPTRPPPAQRSTLPLNPMNPVASTLQYLASQKINPMRAEPMPGHTHTTQHFHRPPLSMNSRDPPSANYDARNRPRSTTTPNVQQYPRDRNVFSRHQPTNSFQAPQSTLENSLLSLARPKFQRPNATHQPSIFNNSERDPGVLDLREYQHVPRTHLYNQPTHNFPLRNPNPGPVIGPSRHSDAPQPGPSIVQQPFNHKPPHVVAAGFKHAVHAHLKPDYDKSLQRVPEKTLDYSIPGTHTTAHFGPGFTIAEVVAGMDASWLFIRGFPTKWSLTRVWNYLDTHGPKFLDMQFLTLQSAGPPLKVQYKTEALAFQAIKSLQGKEVEKGAKLQITFGVKTGTKDNKTTSVIRDMIVQVDLTIPYHNVWVGYENEEDSRAAIEKARVTPFEDFWTTAEAYVGLPAVGFKTVKFVTPGFMKPDDMNTFGRNERVVTALSHRMSPYPTLSQALEGLTKLLDRCDVYHGPVKRMPGPYRNGHIRHYITCYSAEDAVSLANYLDRRWIPDVAKLHARRVFQITMIIERPKYSKSSAQIADIGWSAKKLGYGHSVVVEDSGKGPVEVHVTGADTKSACFLKAQIDKTLNGYLVVGPDGHRLWDDSFEFGEGVVLTRELEQRLHPVTIRRESVRRSIRVYGPPEKALAAVREIEQRITSLSKRTLRSIPLDGALWNYFCEGPFQDLEDELGSEAIQLEYCTRLLHVRGNESVYLTAALAVKEARRKLRAIQSGLDDESDCPACFNKVENPVKLLCGHEYCRDCLQQYLNTAVVMKFFPLTCHGNGGKCKEKVALEIARRILTPSQWNDVLTAAFKTHIQQNPEEFHYCPTPDCNEVYRPGPEGIVYNCPSCFSQICSHCGNPGHPNLTCVELKEGVGEYRVWAVDHNVKQCPRCKMAIEKAAGCNHMTCTLCKTHVCWVCLQMFPDGGNGIYDHMRDKHGGMGLVPEVEENR